MGNGVEEKQEMYGRFVFGGEESKKRDREEKGETASGQVVKAKSAMQRYLTRSKCLSKICTEWLQKKGVEVQKHEVQRYLVTW